MFKRFLLTVILICFTPQACWSEIQQPTIATQEQTQLQVSDANDLGKKILDGLKEIGVDVLQIGVLYLIIGTLDTIVHESGHAVAGSLLFELWRPIEIHIGIDNLFTSTEKWFSVGNMHFYKDFWICGVADINEKRPKEHFHLYEGIMIAAGGTSAAAFLYSLLTMTIGYCAYCDNKNLHEIVAKSFTNACNPFSYILETKNISRVQKRLLINAVFVIGLSFIFNLFYGLTPFLDFGDGHMLWKDHIGVTGTPLSIVHVLSLVGNIGCRLWLVKKYYDARCILAEQAE